ncbi:phosphoinositide phosphatase sac9-related [Anaeramoeba flamelloides]|uniref:Phosphoinositide phosphatase sac9-related n=1 Tax=Anaeramoeba flamelloides TaxID=1746091 RepID=A0ABQ8XPC8_9EUKA|nr:phosphoinositide phosphatase sac9-related [Anaeramoeba flamelloides]
MNSKICKYCFKKYCKFCLSKGKKPIYEYNIYEKVIVCKHCLNRIIKQELYLKIINSYQFQQELPILPILLNRISKLITNLSIPKKLNKKFFYSNYANNLLICDGQNIGDGINNNNSNEKNNNVKNQKQVIKKKKKQIQNHNISIYPSANILKFVKTDNLSLPIESILFNSKPIDSNFWFAPRGIKLVEIPIVLNYFSKIQKIRIVVDQLGYCVDDLPKIKILSGKRLPNLKEIAIWDIKQLTINKLKNENNVSYMNNGIIIPKNTILEYNFGKLITCKVISLIISINPKSRNRKGKERKKKRNGIKKKNGIGNENENENENEKMDGKENGNEGEKGNENEKLRKPRIHLGRVQIIGMYKTKKPYKFNTPLIPNVMNAEQILKLYHRIAIRPSKYKFKPLERILEITYGYNLFNGFVISLTNDNMIDGYLSQPKSCRILIKHFDNDLILKKHSSQGIFEIPKVTQSSTMLFQFEKPSSGNFVSIEFLENYGGKELSSPKIILF